MFRMCNLELIKFELLFKRMLSLGYLYSTLCCAAVTSYNIEITHPNPALTAAPSESQC